MRRTNIIPDILRCDLPRDNRRSFDYRRIEPHMAAANFYMKIAQYQTGQYSKAHKHGSGAILVCIKGKGYRYTWPDRFSMRPWEAGLWQYWSDGDVSLASTLGVLLMITLIPLSLLMRRFITQLSGQQN
jgi:hypothetical protein